MQACAGVHSGYGLSGHLCSPCALSHAVAIGVETSLFFFCSLFSCTMTPIPHLVCPRPSATHGTWVANGLSWLFSPQITTGGDDQPAAAFAHFFPHGRICPMAGCMPAPPVTLHSHFFPCDKRQRPLHRTGRIPAGLAGPGGPHKSASCMLGGCSLEGREAFLQAVNFKRDIDNESISRTVSYKVCPGTVSIK